MGRDWVLPSDRMAWHEHGDYAQALKVFSSYEQIEQ